MLRIVFIIIIVVLPVFTAAGFVTVPAKDRIEGRRCSTNRFFAGVSRDPGAPVQPALSMPEASRGLDPAGFSLLSWNVLKGRREEWAADFLRFSDSKDLIIIQEAALNETLRGILAEMDYNWDLAAAFEYKHAGCGVMTLSKVDPGPVRVLRRKEPLTGIPKSILVTRYPISGRRRTLLVANVHLINFTLTTSHFRAQLQQLESILSAHQGPMIISGDFNTWSESRMAIVNGSAARLGLKTVAFGKSGRTTVFGRNVDHIYYRGLELTEANCIAVSSSDHNPLMAAFRVADPTQTDEDAPVSTLLPDTESLSAGDRKPA